MKKMIDAYLLAAILFFAALRTEHAKLTEAQMFLRYGHWYAIAIAIAIVGYLYADWRHDSNTVNKLK